MNYRMTMAELKKQKNDKPKRPLVSLKISTSDGSRRCCLQYREGGVRVSAAQRLPYPPDTVAYAVCRYIRHCPELRDRLVRRAVYTALHGPSAPQRISVTTSAEALSLPIRAAARIRLSVTPGTVTIVSVDLA